MRFGALGTILLAELTPADRWRAAGRLPFFSLEWRFVLPVLGAVVVGVILIAVYRYRSARREVLRRFAAHLDRLGLTRGERAVLERIAALSGANDLSVALLDRAAFDRGVRNLMASRTVARLTEDQRLAVAAAVEVLRTKLDLAYRGGAEFLEGTAGLQVARGDTVTVARRGDLPAVEAKVARLEGRDLSLELVGESTLQAGEPCLVRFVRQDIQWELSASVAIAAKGLAIVRLVGEQRCVNLRRFARVPVRKPALLARFPFDKGEAPGEAPEFVGGTLTEIAGPGMRIDASVAPQVGERVLVLLRMDEDTTIQGVGKVRRLVHGEGETPVVIVEMVGLSPEEVGRLVRETRAAARQAAVPEDAEPVAAGAQSVEAP
jgi:hypothetical protein